MTLRYVLDIENKGKEFKEKLLTALMYSSNEKINHSDIDKYYFDITYEIINSISDTNGSDQYFYKTGLECIKEKVINEMTSKEISSPVITFIISKIVDFAIDIYFALHANKILKNFTGMLDSVSENLLILLIFEEEKDYV